MNRWIDYPLDERMTMIQHVADAKKIDEVSGENGEPQKVDHDKDPSVIYVKHN
jgi:hypothetical protein